MTVFYRILLGIDFIVAAIALYFFAIGLGDGSVSSFNIVLWMAILGIIVGIMGGGMLLKSRGHARLANGLLLILAFPGFGYGMFVLALIIFQPNWH
jgi:hypothetical protein